LQVKNVSQKVYHPTNDDDFNSSCPIPVICGTNITHWICNWRTVLFPTSPVYCTLGNFKTQKITNSAVKEHLS